MTDDFDPKGMPGFDIEALLQTAQQMGEQMMAAQAETEAAEHEGHAGGGVVKVTVNGAMEFRSVTIDPTVVDPDDVEMLEDLVLAAVRDAVDKASGSASGPDLGAMDLSALTGGMDLGALMGGLGGGLPGAMPGVIDVPDGEHEDEDDG